MQFEIELTLIKHIVKLANLCVHKKPIHPGLSCLRLEANAQNQTLTITSFDLCNALTITVDCAVEMSGKILVPAEDITKLLLLLEGDVLRVSLTSKESQLITLSNDLCLCLEISRKKLYLSCLPTEEYPELPLLVGETPIQLVSTDFIHAISRTIKAASSDDTKMVLTGVNLSFINNSVCVTSTNGHYLATATIPSPNDLDSQTSITLHKTFCNILSKFEELEKEESTIVIYVDKNNIVETNLDVAIAKTTMAKVKVISRVFQEKFPAAHKLIPSSFKINFTVNKKELLQALSLNSYFASMGVKLCTRCETIVSEETGERQLKLSCSKNEKGDSISVLPVQSLSEFESIEFGVNPAYMISLLGGLTSEDIVISLNSPTTPIVMKGVNEPVDCLTLLMPVQLAD